MTTIAILSPGEMGTAIGVRLAALGHRLVTSIDGRGEATQGRAIDSGFECLAFYDTIDQAEVVISLVTPFAALAVAQLTAVELKSTKSKILFVDGNAIAPSTAAEAATIVEFGGADFVDGAIIGSARRLDSAVFYLSGERASDVAALLEGVVPTTILGPKPGVASALKILNSGLAKGLTALGVELFAAAERLGLVPELLERCHGGQVDVAAFLTHTLMDLPPRSARRSQEMAELTAVMDGLGLSSHMSQAAGRVLTDVANEYEKGDTALTRIAQLMAQSAGG